MADEQTGLPRLRAVADSAPTGQVPEDTARAAVDVRAEIALKPTTPGVYASHAEQFSSVFPWMRSPSPADQEAGAKDLASAAGTESLVTELRSWKETVAAGYRDVDLEWLD